MSRGTPPVAPCSRARRDVVTSSVLHVRNTQDLVEASRRHRGSDPWSSCRWVRASRRAGIGTVRISAAGPRTGSMVTQATHIVRKIDGTIVRPRSLTAKLRPDVRSASASTSRWAQPGGQGVLGRWKVSTGGTQLALAWSCWNRPSTPDRLMICDHVLTAVAAASDVAAHAARWLSRRSSTSPGRAHSPSCADPHPDPVRSGARTSGPRRRVTAIAGLAGRGLGPVGSRKASFRRV